MTEAKAKQVDNLSKTNKKNYNGMRFHNYVVIKREHRDEKKQWWFLCRCDCGKTFLIRGGDLGHVKSCGCMTKEYIARGQRTHGESKSRLYNVWHKMKDRCNRPTHKSYKDYGGRGIKVCPEWEHDYEAFAKWARENGYDENAEFMKCTIERIDPNGMYEPSNCTFKSMKEQCNNRRNNHRLTLNGETHTIAEWSEITGIQFCTLWRRWKKGWTVERILESPLRRTEEETIEMTIELFKENEYVTNEMFKERVGRKNITKYIGMLKERGYHIVTEWQYVGKPSGWRGRYKLYYLGEKENN